MPTGYGSVTVWLVIALTGVLTLAIRESFIYLFGHIDDVSPAVEPASEYVPAAVFATLVFPTLLAPSGDLAVSVDNGKLIAGALAALAAWYTKRVLVTTLIDMDALWVPRFVV